ncbi:biotin-dependent carboxyltransferase family protein [Paraburkholderia silviterrae]|uniref:Biotin-dependent carboxyltransferase family protein n=1 Tax=Paraburkholderia silviterrae TaxID=2528715 RepID=A0A4R5LXK0_9BURK|nr:biotin-dependent carboxyltransferase family protein [Paraburkholderia silviterrae]TDG16767.1 biotin-dependent carboxyltransferase family protein [Paraburkholderia silviterrae]
MIEVLRAGLLTTVQDLGRPGFRHLGVATGGALDTLALEVGNRLVGNRHDAAGLEITFGPVALRFARATRVAITGTEFGATLDGKPVWSWWSLPVAAGEALVLNGAKRGMRAYVCVAGGIDVLPMLGSRSTDLSAGFGGLAGRALKDGDRLATGASFAAGGERASLAPGAPPFGVKAPSQCSFVYPEEAPHRRGRHPDGMLWAVPVRVLRGPEYDSFTPEAQRAFWSDEWRVTPNSNRMGYRLEGTPLERAARTDLLSHAVLPGTIQVPPNGQPIVLMSDAQTTGGYPKIGAVIRADLWKLAQVRLTAGLRFVEATAAVARRALLEEQAYLRQIDTAIAMQDERHASRRARSASAQGLGA